MVIEAIANFTRCFLCLSGIGFRTSSNNNGQKFRYSGFPFSPAAFNCSQSTCFPSWLLEFCILMEVNWIGGHCLKLDTCLGQITVWTLNTGKWVLGVNPWNVLSHWILAVFAPTQTKRWSWQHHLKISKHGKVGVRISTRDLFANCGR